MMNTWTTPPQPGQRSGRYTADLNTGDALRPCANPERRKPGHRDERDEEGSDDAAE